METWMLSLVLGILGVIVPVLGWITWWWNEIWYVTPVKARCSTFYSKLPPGHLGLPFFGETLSFLWLFNVVGRPDDFITSKIYKYGKNVGIYRSYLYGSPSIIACSPALCKLILNSGDKFRVEWPTTKVLGSNAVATLEGERHRMIKHFIAHSFTRPDALSWIVLQIQPSITAALQLWSQQPKIKALYQVKKVILDYTLRYVARLEIGTQIDAVEKLMEGIIHGLRAQPCNFPGTNYYHALKCRKKLLEMLKVELEKKEEKIKNTSMEGEDSTSDLMDGLMRIKDKDGIALSDDVILDNVVHTIAVGHISITYAVTWSLYFLAKSPAILQKLREENKDLSENNGGCITYEDVTKLKYTNKVVEETIRMANLAGFVFRKAADDIEFEGYIIPKDWNVIVWLRHLHNDPTNFEDPTNFNPDRWDERPKYGTYFPFGGGSRSCLGSMLVRVSLALFLHHLSIGYEWELLNPNMKVKYLSHPLPGDGLEITMRKINC